MTFNNIEKLKEENTIKIRQFFLDYLDRVNYKGTFGVAKFSSVYNDLMPVQQDNVKNKLKERFLDFMNTGSIISIGIFYAPDIIDCINVNRNDIIDLNRWNLYSDEYQHINDMLKVISKNIADEFNGIAYTPTTGTPSEQIKNVKDYYYKTISHRLVAEYAGVGWRGKSELIITEEKGPTIRFTSILINIPMIQGLKLESKCGECTACLEVCPILKNKEFLEDYRENCRKFLINLGLKHEVCGKCIKACFRESIYKRNFKAKL
ncbi:MAG: hypothetical protein ACFFDK_12875 [Promethearchaeota archaeon]